MATMTIRRFIGKHKVKMVSRWADCPTDADDWARSASHWRCTFGATVGGQRRRLTVPFSMGSAHTGDPDVENVLDCVASDCRSFESNPTFGDWALDFGYDPDSRKVEKVFRACRKQAQKVKAWLGEAAYAELLETESL